MVMRAIIEEADVETSKSMQTLSLTEGAFLTHLHMALLAQGKDLRVLTNKQLSGHLIGLWLADNQPANDLMTRCLVCISRNNGLGNFLQNIAMKRTRMCLFEKLEISKLRLCIACSNEQCKMTLGFQFSRK